MGNEIVNKLIVLWETYQNGIISGVIATFAVTVIVKIWKKIKNPSRSINELLNNIDYNSKNWRNDVDKTLRIKDTMKTHFPEYKGYLLIQYGSSVSPDNKLPCDYDFIVLMLGYPDNGNRYMHNKGTISDEADSSNKDQVDIVFRDYLSFLFAASAGMPYENSVVAEGECILGNEGYFRWIQNITKNILFDRDFLIRRFNDKIAIEKQEFQKCLNEHEKYEHDKYYVIRSGYYYITSILQLNRIKKFEKVITQKQIIELSKVRNLYTDFKNVEIGKKYEQLVENLKRNKDVNLISIDDIKKILDGIEE